MTITVTVEELKGYETALREWANRFAAEHARIAHAAMRDHARLYSSRHETLEDMKNSLAEWTKANPQPTLLPRV